MIAGDISVGRVVTSERLFRAGPLVVTLAIYETTCLMHDVRHENAQLSRALVQIEILSHPNFVFEEVEVKNFEIMNQKDVYLAKSNRSNHLISSRVRENRSSNSQRSSERPLVDDPFSPAIAFCLSCRPQA